jgi:hypothetical protein
MHMFYNAVYPKCWAKDITYTLSTPTHCQELLKFVRSHGRLKFQHIEHMDSVECGVVSVGNVRSFNVVFVYELEKNFASKI